MLFWELEIVTGFNILFPLCCPQLFSVFQNLSEMTWFFGETGHNHEEVLAKEIVGINSIWLIYFLRKETI